MLPPLSDLHRIECWLLHHGLRLKVILRPALPRHGPHYECGALLTSATEELKWCSREDSHLELPPSQSGVQNSYTSGAKKWCAMPVLPRRPRFGRPPCLLLHQ